VITQFCIIRNQTIILNGKVIFSGTGALNDFMDDAYAFLKVDYPKFYKMDGLSKLGFLAAEAMLKDRMLLQEYSSESIAIILSNAHSSLDTDKRYLETTKTLASPALFVYTLPNIVAGEICIRHKIKGENAFFISPAFDPELMADYANMVLTAAPSLATPVGVLTDNAKGQMPNACLAGWIDVLGPHHDVFLYLLEKNKPGLLAHTAEQLKELYNTTLWNN
jgi:hypothetical protein